MTILETFERKHGGSAALYRQAQTMLPSGVTHDARYSKPFPLYVERSHGARKWDVDGNELIDYWMGHGSLLLGHSHPTVVAAVQEQMARGTHYGAEHRLTLRWAELVQHMFPSVERVRFTSSGTEATMMALRLARAFTGRPTVIRFAGHYHGWHDTLAHGIDMDLVVPTGVPEALLETTLALPLDLALVEQVLHERDDIAAVILEPTGASYGMAPFTLDELRRLRALTTDRGVLLICDEVVTGFRVAPGGAQELAGISADLTSLAKILSGGLPGGAIGGREEIMRLLAFGGERKIRHNGTFNANPLSAAAGVAALELVADGEAVSQAAAMGQILKAGLNDALRDRQARGWAVYGTGSIFHLIAQSDVGFPAGDLPADVPATELKRGGDEQVVAALRMALINHGIDLMRGHSGFVSTAHTASDIDATVAAFAAAVDDVMQER